MNDMRKIKRKIVWTLACLLLTSCAQTGSGWLDFGVDLKTSLGIRPDPIENFAECIKKHETIPVRELEKILQEEVESVRKNKASGDWGSIVCLAFNENASASQIETVMTVLSEQEASVRQDRFVGMVRSLLRQRAECLTRLGSLERQLDNNIKAMNKLRVQIEKLQGIEELLEKNEGPNKPGTLDEAD